jgi:micrococcal nuclease
MPRQNRYSFQIGTFILLLCSFVAHAADVAPLRGTSLTGRVVSIADGDTLTVLVDEHTQYRIRLWGVDAPEKKQAFGTRAKQYAGDLAFGKTVTVIEHGTDRYGRTIGEVILPDGRNFSQALTAAGLCWWYRRYAPHDYELQRLEREAREQKRGLWADNDPTPPWDWRATQRTTR